MHMDVCIQVAKTSARTRAFCHYARAKNSVFNSSQIFPTLLQRYRKARRTLCQQIRARISTFVMRHCISLLVLPATLSWGLSKQSPREREKSESTKKMPSCDGPSIWQDI